MMVLMEGLEKNSVRRRKLAETVGTASDVTGDLAAFFPREFVPLVNRSGGMMLSLIATGLMGPS